MTYREKRSATLKMARKNYQLYLIILPVVAYFLVFCYQPMYGLLISFKDYLPTQGIWGSPWTSHNGLGHFYRFFNSYNFVTVIANTLGISLYSLVVGFPLPILLALMLNEVPVVRFKKLIQTVTYAPYFISTVVIVGILKAFLSPNSGVVNVLFRMIGAESINFLGEPSMFKTIYVVSGLWQNLGWNSIIFLAALSGVDPELYEAAVIDGASRMKKIWHIDLPGILPTITIVFLLNVGSIMNVGFEKVFLMQNPLNMPTSDVISTFVYRSGLVSAQFSFASAVGMFNSIVNFCLLVIVNAVTRRLGEASLW